MLLKAIGPLLPNVNEMKENLKNWSQMTAFIRSHSLSIFQNRAGKGNLIVMWFILYFSKRG